MKIKEPVKNVTPSMVMFEINDEKRQSERSNHEYFPLFVEFIQSLGFKTFQHFPTSTSLVINDDCDVDIDVNNASYLSRNSYTREVYVRKPENRYVRLKVGFSPERSIIKIFFNKEYDANKLREKINTEIERQRAVVKSREDRKDYDKNNTKIIGKHYSTALVRKFCKNINISQGLISFYSDDFCLDIKPDGSFAGFNFFDKNQKCEKEIDFEGYGNRLMNLHGCAIAIYKELNVPQLDVEVQEWAKSTSHKHFNVKTQKADRD